jgi:hypothetical protein
LRSLLGLIFTEGILQRLSYLTRDYRFKYKCVKRRYKTCLAKYLIKRRLELFQGILYTYAKYRKLINLAFRFSILSLINLLLIFTIVPINTFGGFGAYKIIIILRIVLTSSTDRSGSGERVKEVSVLLILILLLVF